MSRVKKLAAPCALCRPFVLSVLFPACDPEERRVDLAAPKADLEYRWVDDLAFEEITSYEVIQATRNIATGKTVGLDGVPRRD